MIIRSDSNWTAKRLNTEITKGNVNFDCVVQRGYVWKDDRNSLLIHSLMTDYTVPPFYFIKSDERGKYDAIDGKQRSNAISAFIRDEYILALDERYQVVNFMDGAESVDEDVEGKKFSELSKALQDKILDFTFKVYFFDACITEEEIAEMFFRLNNGRPLAAVDLMRARAKCLNEFNEIAQHPVIQEVKGKVLRADEGIAFQVWAMLNLEKPDFNTPVFRPIIETAEVTKEQIKAIKKALDMVNYAYNVPKEDTKDGKKLRTRMRRKTHVVSLAYAAKIALERGVSKTAFAKWAMDFFSGKGSDTTVSKLYNEAAGRGSAKPEKIACRKEEITDNLNTFIIKTRAKADFEEKTEDIPVEVVSVEATVAPVEASEETDTATLDTDETSTDEAVSA